MIEETLKYPLNSEDTSREYLVGILLTLGSILIIPFFILLGYSVKIMSETLDGGKQIPKFEDYPRLLLDGLKLIGVIFIYILLSLIMGALFGSIGEKFVRSLFAVIGFILMLLIFYLMPSAIVNFARTGRARDAFAIKTVFKKAFTLKYAVGLTVLGILAPLISIIRLIMVSLLVITIIGIPLALIVGPGISFYGRLLTYRILAKSAE